MVVDWDWDSSGLELDRRELLFLGVAGVALDQRRIAPNAHLTAPWPMQLGWGLSGDNLCATFMPRLWVYGRLMAPAHTGGATGIGR